MHLSRGFSLIEMAVVMAIIGLLVGGVMMGRNLIRVQQVRSVLADAQHYKRAMLQFQDKHGYLPGDFLYATRVWGRADGGSDLNANCATPTTDTNGPILTCNGNGDGGVYSTQVAATSYESFRLWQHLSAAGYIAGHFTGVAGSAGVSDVEIGTNSPNVSIKNTSFHVQSQGYYVNNSARYDADYNNAMFYGIPTTTGYTTNEVLLPKDAYQMDLKVDDGLPNMGNILSWKPAQNPCVNATTVKYDRTLTVGACSLIFLNGFEAKLQQ